MGCKTNADGTSCPDLQDDTSCSPFQLSTNEDLCFIESVVEEALNIGGADIHVFKLLGVHEQGMLNDLTSNGTSISGGDLPSFVSANAFTSFVTEWRSAQQGSGVISSAFIGYDFGEIRLDNNRVQYGVDTAINHTITTFKIKQSDNSNNRITRARMERSSDGINWFGVAIITLPDNNDLNTLSIKHSVPSRYWRLRPVDFNGTATDTWNVSAIQFFDYNETSIDNIQDSIFVENRDRDYAPESVTIKATYDLLDTQSELTRFGIELPSQLFYLQLSFNACIQSLGRPVIIGDIVEIPSETQYSATLEPIKKYLEITDVGWSTEGYAPGWQPTMLRAIAQPALASQETQDIFGDLASSVDSTGLHDMNDGNNPLFQDISNIDQTIEADSNTLVPERGREAESVIHKFSDEQIQSAADQGLPNLGKIGVNSTGLYTEDGLPPNGEDFTEGDTLPASPSGGDYHRLTYNAIQQSSGGIIPPRLFRFSLAKNRWIYLETDRRLEFNQTKPKLQGFLSSPTKINTQDIGD